MNFLSKKNKADEDEGKDEEKKIEFSQKLTDQDKEDLSKKKFSLKKGIGFNFFKNGKDVETPASAFVPPKQGFGGQAGEAKSASAFAAAGASDEKERSERGKIFAKTLSDRKPGAAFSPAAAPEKGSGKKFFGAGGLGFLKKSGQEKKENVDILEVNLVRGEIVKFFDWQKNILILLVSVFISLFMISLVYWGIAWWGSQIKYDKEDSLIQSYYQLNKQIKELEAEVAKVLEFKDGVLAVNFLLDKHIYWTNFFNFLEENTLSNVYFSSFSGGIGSEYGLSAKSNDFNAIEAQVEKFLESRYVNKAEVSAGSISKGEGGAPDVSFNLNFSLKPDIFLK